ncbi:50S ribosomal protein L3 [Planctomycetales bacterium 10988]|nr:50S ribosomal protein L3 [Planctomycetales bacterium 10988]
MSIGLIGRKVGMTQVYQEDGTAVPVTVIQAGPCTVLQIRTVEKDGYEAVQVGYGEKPRRLASRSERGHVAALDSNRSRQRKLAGVEVAEKPDCEPPRVVREFRVSSGDYSVGQALTVPVFEGVKAVDVSGISKGRGFAGVMKRHNFAGQRASHGVKKCHRYPGSIGQAATPSRVPKGRKMAGQYGNANCTVRNLKVVRVDEENQLVLVKGAIPGPNGGYVVLKPTNKAK